MYAYVYMHMDGNQGPGIISSTGSQPAGFLNFEKIQLFDLSKDLVHSRVCPGDSRSWNRILTTFFPGRLCGRLISFKL